MTSELNAEADRLTRLLRGKSVIRAKRLRRNELLIEFEDGMRFVNAATESLDFSITGEV